MGGKGSIPPRNNIRQIIILNHPRQRFPRTLTPLIHIPHNLDSHPRQARQLNNIIPRQTRRNLIHPFPQPMNIIVRQPNPQILAQRTYNRPILSGDAGGRDSGTGVLGSALEVDVCG